MKTNRLIYTLVFLFTGFFAGAQNPQLEQKVTLQYAQERLENVLYDISESYQVHFAYSNNIVPIDQKISLSVRDANLNKALDELFAETQVVYTPIGSQVVLNVDPSKKRRLGMNKPQPIPLQPNPDNEILVKKENLKLTERLPDLPKKKLEQLPGGNSMVEIDLERYQIVKEGMNLPQDEELSDHQLAQVSVWPGVGTNFDRSEEVTNTISVNLLWGTNGGVDGLEMGLLANSIVNDMNGMQVAGFANSVKGDVTGTQLSGAVNKNRGYTKGIQFSGLVNITEKTNAIQGAGLANVVNRDFRGIQVAGLFNKVKSDADGTQIAGLYNHNTGYAGTEASGVFNKAKDVKYGQVSGFLNIARNVKGFQIGVINVSDTISGVPFGILNFVKKGYNRLEISGGDALHANIGLKFGAPSFYNILHIGVGSWETAVKGNTGWGIGYGIGTVVTLTPRAHFNFEGLAIQINEGELWTDKLNLLNQFRWTMDIRLGKQQKSSMFFGPTFNVLVSRLYDADTQKYGSSFAPYTHYETTSSKGTNVKLWTGFNIGFRF